MSLVRQMTDPLIGTMLPRHYRITGKLGRGAMSVVYSGVYEPFNKPVAIKLLKSHLVSDTQTFKRFQQEAKTAGALEHANIVGIFDFGVTEQGVPYLIMELLHGQSLSERLKEVKCLASEAAVDIFIQAAEALEYTHQRGIVHRDVKPSNILLIPSEGRDIVKIVDFGIAKLQSYDGSPSSSLTVQGEVVGTPLYVSPEQAMGKNIDSRADIYSLGCVMYEAIVGRAAFSGPTAFDVIRMQISVDPMPINKARPDLDLPAPLISAVARAMCKNPDDRYQTMADLLVDLHRAQSVTSTMRIVGTSKTRSVITNSSMEMRALNNALNQPRPSSDSVRLLGKPSGTVPAYVPPSPSGDAAPGAVSPKPGKVMLPLKPFLLASVGGCLLGLVVLLCLQQLRLTGNAALLDTHGEGIVSPSEHGVTAPLVGSKEQLSSKDLFDPKAAEHYTSAAAFLTKGEVGSSIAENRKALAIVSRLGQEKAEAAVCIGLSSSYRQAGKVGEAYSAAHRSSDVLQKVPAERGLSDELVAEFERLSTAFEKKKDSKHAESCLKEGLRLSERVYGHGSPKLVPRLSALSSYLKAHHKIVESQALERAARSLGTSK